MKKSYARTSIAMLLIVCVILALTGCGSRQLTPDTHRNAYAGDPIIETAEGYYFDFGTERLVVGGNQDAASVHTNGSIVSIAYFANDEESETPAEALLFDPSDYSYTNLEWDGDKLELDFTGLHDGGYTVRLDNLFVDLYYTANQLWVCYFSYDAEIAKEEIARIETLQAFIADSGVTPENSLSNTKKDFAYPIIDSLMPYWRCDTDKWAALAHDIVGDTTGLTKTDIAARLAAWMTENIAFDFYVTEVLDVTRATAADDWSGKYSVYELHAGKCVDFATIYCIMCREMGIPCNSLATPTHVWNIVYLDGQWIEIDLTRGVQYLVYGEDAAERVSVYVNPLDIIVRSYDFSGIDANSGMLTYKFVTTGED